MIEDIQEMIDKLEALKAEHGNIAVLAYDNEGDATFCIDAVEFNDDEGACVLITLEPAAS